MSRLSPELIRQAYSSFPQQLSTFTRALGIAEPLLDAELIERLVEVKASRNVLLHGDLRANRLYELKAGRFRRQAAMDGRLPMSVEYVVGACRDLQSLVLELEARLTSKYRSYTRIAALRRLWAHLFSSPIMPFDEYWVLDEAKDEVVALKQGPSESRISNSERMFLSVWRAHFNGWKDPDATLQMYSLDAENRRKMLWLLATLVEFDVR